MPELPEVEVARRQLARWTADRAIVRVLLQDPAAVRATLSSRPSDRLADAAERLAPLVGAVGTEPVRHGKRLGWVVGGVGLLAHFGMTAHLVRRRAGDEVPDLARLGFELDDGTVAWFVDGRRFGCFTPVEPGELSLRLREGCGPDALREPLDAAGLRAALKGRRPLKVALMDQTKLAGLGNIHAAEACFRARIGPSLPCAEVPAAGWERLAEAIPRQLREAVEAEDSDADLVYVNLGGPNPFAVYGRGGEPCGTCGAAIRSEEMAGRTTYWCPTCQATEPPA